MASLQSLIFLSALVPAALGSVYGWPASSSSVPAIAVSSSIQGSSTLAWAAQSSSLGVTDGEDYVASACHPGHVTVTKTVTVDEAGAVVAGDVGPSGPWGYGPSYGFSFPKSVVSSSWSVAMPTGGAASESPVSWKNGDFTSLVVGGGSYGQGSGHTIKPSSSSHGGSWFPGQSSSVSIKPNSSAWYSHGNGSASATPSQSSSGSSSTAPSSSATPGTCSYWMEDIEHQGIAAFNSNPGTYTVFRNVKDFGAKGDGSTDDTAAINDAISAGNRCAPGICASSTTSPAVIYFPPGTYIVSSPIIDYYYTQIIGNPNCMPVIKASSGFTGGYVVDGDQYQSNGNLGVSFLFHRVDGC